MRRVPSGQGRSRGQRRKVLLIGKARQVIIGLRFEVAAGDAALGIGFEDAAGGLPW